MFFRLWNEISLFHKLRYDTARRRILIGLDVAFCLLRHGKSCDVGAFSAVKSVEILDKTAFFLRLKAITCDKKNLKWIFFSYSIFDTRCVLNTPCSGTRNLDYKYRMRRKFIQIPYVKDLLWVRGQVLLQYFDHLFKLQIWIEMCIYWVEKTYFFGVSGL